MRWFPSIFRLPELRGIERVQLRAHWSTFTRQPAIRYWISLSRTGHLAMAMIALTFSSLAILWEPWPTGAIIASLMVVLWALVSFNLARLTVTHFQQTFVAYVQVRLVGDRPVPCESCGYDLRGTMLHLNAACPECGASVRPAESLQAGGVT